MTFCGIFKGPWILIEYFHSALKGAQSKYFKVVIICGMPSVPPLLAVKKSLTMTYNIYRTTGFVLHKQYQTEEEEKKEKNIYIYDSAFWVGSIVES